jgi:rod shape-determining protein MreD
MGAKKAAASAPRPRSVDAQVSVAPRFTTLLGFALLAVLLQGTLLHDLTLRGAHASPLTVLIVWTGLRCGVVTGGWLGLLGGLFEDALGGGGVQVLGATLVGYLAGLLSNRFFSDSLPVFLSAVAVGTVVRSGVQYLVLEIGLGERGLFHRLSHETVYAIVLNCVIAAGAVLVLRVIAARSR